MRFSKYFCIGLFLLVSLFSKVGLAQTAHLENSLAPHFSITTTPENISASDGLYTKYVLVRWMSPGSAQSFQVYKSPDEKISNASLLNEKSLESSWLLDYDVKPGVKYFYWVKAAYEESATSPYSKSDDGFASTTENIALEEEDLDASIENLAITEPERFDPNPFLEPMITDTRSTAFKIELVLPKVAEEYQPAPNLEIDFEGTIESLPEDKLLLHIYTNNKDTFIKDLTLVKTVLSPIKDVDEENYSFKRTIPFPYPSGLYYYSIQLEGEEDPIKIGKLLVK